MGSPRARLWNGLVPKACLRDACGSDSDLALAVQLRTSPRSARDEHPWPRLEFGDLRASRLSVCAGDGAQRARVHMRDAETRRANSRLAGGGVWGTCGGGCGAQGGNDRVGNVE
jgi:hypothetical protein